MLDVTENGFIGLCISFILLASSASPSTIDLTSHKVIRPPPEQSNIHFGFSLAHFSNGYQRSLLVGAPRANTSQDVVSPGALYSCDVASGECSQINVDSLKSKYKTWISEEIKGHQGLGHSVAANGNNIVVCAPRWHIFDRRTGLGLEDFAFGKCFVGKTPDSEFVPFSNSFLDDTAGSSGTTGYCQFGMSLAFKKNEDSVLVGGPGCWSWQGDVWEVAITGDAWEKDTDIFQNKSRNCGRLSLDDVKLEDRNPGSAGSLANLYMSYSVAHFIYEDTPAIAAAVPKVISTNDINVIKSQKNQVFGPMILILKEDKVDAKKLKVVDILKPPGQEGDGFTNGTFSFFGYSMAVADVNGDNHDDLVVGAPFHPNHTMQQDQGAIFVYMQESFGSGSEIGDSYQMKPEERQIPRMGEASHGRFGSCVVALGDLNMDGYQDIAVGAPYSEGNGAVFIYMGSKNGLQDKPSQVIRPSDFLSGAQPISGFGFSIAHNALRRGTNEAVVFAVGAYRSDAVVVFHVKDIVSVEWEMTFTPEKMDLNDREQQSVSVKVCLKFERTKMSPNTVHTVGFEVALSADVKSQEKRLLFNNGRDTTKLNYTVQDQERSCQYSTVTAKEGIQDNVSPFGFTGKLSCLDDKVIMNQSTRVKIERELPIVLHCKGSGSETGSCLSHLQLYIEGFTSFNLDTKESININFTVKNTGDPAYNTRLKIMSTGSLTYESHQGQLECEKSSEQTGIICPIDNTFIEKKEETFTVTLSPDKSFNEKLRSHESFFQVNATLVSSSNITVPEDARQYFQIPIEVDGTLELSRDSSAISQVQYNDSSYFKSPGKAESLDELGPPVYHTYKIYNRHNFPIYKTEVRMTWPLKIDDLYFLYLEGMPSFTEVQPDCKYSNGKVDEFNLLNDEIQSNGGKFNEGQDSGSPRSSLPSLPSTVGKKNTKKTIKYIRFQCTIGEIGGRQEVKVSLKSRLVQTTLTKLAMGNSIGEVKSLMMAKAMELPLQSDPPKNYSEVSSETIISYANAVPIAKVAWWIILLAVLGGLLVLILIIIGLWKCGFFKRKKMDKIDGASPESDALCEKGDGKEGDEQENGEENTHQLDSDDDGHDEEEDTKTPISALLRDTETADDEFQYSQSPGNKSDNV